MEQLLNDIVEYFEYLKQTYDYHIAFHNAAIPLGNYMARLSPYNINSHPYCLCVKSNNDAWNYCIKRQQKVFAKCKEGPFVGTCYAGMGEYVFPILDFDTTVLGFINIGGYYFDESKSKKCINRISRDYLIEKESLIQSFHSNVKPSSISIKKMQNHIAPLCQMFVLLHHELIKLYGTVKLENMTQNYILSHAVVFLDRNYMKPIRAKDIANACHCSVSSISHIFKKNTGLGIFEYVNNLRVKDVKKYLRNTNFSILQISEIVGYGSPNYMSEVFKQHTGLSPRDYRKKYGEC